MRRERVGFDVPDIWRRMFDFDLERGGWLRVEESREGDTWVVRAEIPGIDPDRDVELSVEDGALQITARREMKSEQQDESGFRSEFRYGTFSRTVMLPPGVKESDIKASYKDGLLEVRIPIAKEQIEPKKIPISKD